MTTNMQAVLAQLIALIWGWTGSESAPPLRRRPQKENRKVKTSLRKRLTPSPWATPSRGRQPKGGREVGMPVTNEELLKQALDALTELERRGNAQLERARQDVEFLYEHYLGLKSLAISLERASADD